MLRMHRRWIPQVITEDLRIANNEALQNVIPIILAFKLSPDAYVQVTCFVGGFCDRRKRKGKGVIY